METLSIQSPYQATAQALMLSGWTVLPLPTAAKFPPPQGYTGSEAIEVEEELALGEWMETGGNLALRLPDGVIGLDVDAYKDGGETFKALIASLGALPETAIITSQASLDLGGTYLFSVPSGTRLRGSHGSVDIIQSHHRYVVAPPSIHPSGRIYRWVSSSGLELPWLPEPDSFPTLPDAWLKFLSAEPSWMPEANDDNEDFGFEAGTMCKAMASRLKGGFIRLKEKSASRHDLMLMTTWALTGEAVHGHTGYEAAVDAYQKAWEKTFTAAERRERPIGLEFDSAVRGAQRKQGGIKGACSCESVQPHHHKRSKDLKMWH